MKALLRNPISLWLKWFIQSRIILYKNKNKNLKIGYLTNLFNVKVGQYNTLFQNVTIGNSVLGNYIYIANGAKIGNATIGNFCSIGPNVKIAPGIHPTNHISTFPAFFSTKKQCQVSFVKENYIEESGSVIIGNDVWIGYNAIIMDNVKIGNGAIIAAGAIVTKDVPPYTIVAGVPAKPIRKRFNEHEIEILQNFKWWDKDLDWIKKNAELFNTPDDFFSKVLKMELTQKI